MTYVKWNGLKKTHPFNDGSHSVGSGFIKSLSPTLKLHRNVLFAFKSYSF